MSKVNYSVLCLIYSEVLLYKSPQYLQTLDYVMKLFFQSKNLVQLFVWFYLSYTIFHLPNKLTEQTNKRTDFIPQRQQRMTGIEV